MDTGKDRGERRLGSVSATPSTKVIQHTWDRSGLCVDWVKFTAGLILVIAAILSLHTNRILI